MGMEDKMKNVFKKIDGVKTGIFAAGVLFLLLSLFAQENLRYYQARMLRRYTRTVQQQFFVLRSV